MALQQHTRSHSFPSGSSSQQDAMIQVDESLLCGSTPSSSSSAKNRVNSLQKLHESINGLLLLPHIQRAIARECPRLDEITEGYVVALDACAAAGDVVSAAKRDAQELLSGVRRRHAEAAASSYLASRRELRKVARTQKWLKKIGKRQSLGKGCEIEQLMMDAKSATLATLSCVFSYVVSSERKLVGSKRAEQTEFTKVDAALIAFMNNGDGDMIRDDHLLRVMESSIRVVEEGLECLFRQLIKTRVLLLNVLSH
ncbi:uncharacterized protein LOC131020877 [Salvia miltiorrhiza]|uniref:uncharacterized protein LOC131020877 n=1 Tax=Salvia miltiorrhiza TaxID=226208 RepID=UPI0025AD8425|nr:uncharacterized protein LOC131020877 [Salvia miltiorrhiza]